MAFQVSPFLQGRQQPLRLINPVMVAQEAVGHLKRLFQKMRGRSNPCALDLPVEIILMVVAYLDGCSLASLSLTCKSLHGLWDPYSMPLILPDKEKLLLWLERDIPYIYYCHHCTKLHRWHGRWSRSIAPFYLERLLCKQNSDNHFYIPITCQIPYHHARLVMNRHLYGRNHGLPLHVLNERARSSHHPDGVIDSRSQHARIFNQQLLILSTISMTHRRGDPLALRDHIDRAGHLVCKHLTLRQGYPDSYPTPLPQLAKGTGPDAFLACSLVNGSCNSCLTDYTIDIIWQGAKKGYRIEVLVYRGLGDCRTPFSWHWRTASRLFRDEQPRLAYSSEYRLGGVREQWNKAGYMA